MDCESCRLAKKQGARCGDCDAEQILLLTVQAGEDVRSAISIAKGSEVYKGNPQFAAALRRIDKQILSQIRSF